MKIKYTKMRYLQRITFLLLLLTLIGCNSSKKVVYLQDAVPMGQQAITSKYDLRIKKDDMLSIIVNCKEPALAAPFNMQLIPDAFTGANQVTGSYGSGTPQGFLVDSNGEIDYPIFGKLQVEGLTRMELAEAIAHFLKSNGYINDPVVNVKLINFKVSVLGEVQRPGVLKIDSERITLLEALAQAGDLSIYGRRQNIKLVREEGGKREVVNLDITDPTLLNSPYYFLQQNDMVYVEPNKSKVFQGTVSTFWSPVLSVISLLTTIGLYFAR